MDIAHLFENGFYLLALLNPASKVLFLATYKPNLTKRQNIELSWRSSLAATIILSLLAAVGSFLFFKVFRVQLYSLQILGGLILFFIGWTAIIEGKFINKQSDFLREGLNEISLVPLATPLIAGPGMITAVITQSVEFGLLFTLLSLTIAIFINFLLMLLSSQINIILNKVHLIGPLIRFAGLITGSVATQMILTGIKCAMK